MAPLEIRILGPMTVMVDGGAVEPGGRRQRALLGALVLEAGTPVSVDKLIDSVWGERPPASARHLVHVYVSQLRGVVGSEALVTRSGAYVLEIGDDAVDARRFARLVADARARRDLGVYDDALGLWRGPALADVELGTAAASAARRLDDLRLAAVEERAELLLAAGRHAELVPELRELLAGEPFRERLRAQLMLALYRSGRQSEAIAVYSDGRRQLAEELGVEPGLELRQLERAILEHDPAIAAPSRVATVVRKRRFGLVVAGLAALTGAVVATAVIRSADAGSRALRPGSVGILDGRSARVLASSRVGDAATVLAVARGSVWLGDGSRNRVVSLDPRSARVGRAVRVAAPPHALAVVGRTLWVADGFDGALQQVVGNRASRPFKPAPSSTGRTWLAYGAGMLWAASQDGYLLAVDPATHAVRTRIRIGLSNAVALDGNAIWVAAATRDAVLHVDVRSRRARTIPVGGIPTRIAVDGGAVWVATPREGSVWRIDPRHDDVVASVRVPERPDELAATGGLVWIASHSGSVLVGIDATSNSIARIVQLPTAARALAGDGRRLWLTLSG